MLDVDKPSSNQNLLDRETDILSQKKSSEDDIDFQPDKEFDNDSDNSIRNRSKTEEENKKNKKNKEDEEDEDGIENYKGHQDEEDSEYEKTEEDDEGSENKDNKSEREGNKKDKKSQSDILRLNEIIKQEEQAFNIANALNLTFNKAFPAIEDDFTKNLMNPGGNSDIDLKEEIDTADLGISKSKMTIGELLTMACKGDDLELTKKIQEKIDKLATERSESSQTFTKASFYTGIFISTAGGITTIVAIVIGSANPAILIAGLTISGVGVILMIGTKIISFVKFHKQYSNMQDREKIQEKIKDLQQQLTLKLQSAQQSKDASFVEMEKSNKELQQGYTNSQKEIERSKEFFENELVKRQEQEGHRMRLSMQATNLDAENLAKNIPVQEAVKKMEELHEKEKIPLTKEQKEQYAKNYNNKLIIQQQGHVNKQKQEQEQKQKQEQEKKLQEEKNRENEKRSQELTQKHQEEMKAREQRENEYQRELNRMKEQEERNLVKQKELEEEVNKKERYRRELEEKTYGKERYFRELEEKLEKQKTSSQSEVNAMREKLAEQELIVQGMKEETKKTKELYENSQKEIETLRKPVAPNSQGESGAPSSP